MLDAGRRPLPVSTIVPWAFLLGVTTLSAQDVSQLVVGQKTMRASVSSSGAEGNRYSAVVPLAGSSISGDGRLAAFMSAASNLVDGDTNGFLDAFVHDRSTGLTVRVSVDSSGAEGNDISGDHGVSISADGRFVAFKSHASNLVAGDANGYPDVFVHDSLAGLTERVSVDSSGLEGNGYSGLLGAAISEHGRFVAFGSSATNLVAGDVNGFEDLFVRDRQSGTTELVSVDSQGAQGNARSVWPSISADGRFVAFQSEASNLVSGDANGCGDVFVNDRSTGHTERVSVDSSGAESNGSSSNFGLAISANGRFVAFVSSATNLVANDTNGYLDVFVHDRLSGLTERASVGSFGVESNELTTGSTISGDGRFVGFESYATNLVDGDTNCFLDAFVHDRSTGLTERVSVNSSGMQGNERSYVPALSSDGLIVVFLSFASDLVVGDTNEVSDVLVRDRRLLPRPRRR